MCRAATAGDTDAAACLLGCPMTRIKRGPDHRIRAFVSICRWAHFARGPGGPELTAFVVSQAFVRNRANAEANVRGGTRATVPLTRVHAAVSGRRRQIHVRRRSLQAV